MPDHSLGAGRAHAGLCPDTAGTMGSHKASKELASPPLLASRTHCRHARSRPRKEEDVPPLVARAPLPSPAALLPDLEGAGEGLGARLPVSHDGHLLLRTDIWPGTEKMGCAGVCGLPREGCRAPTAPPGASYGQLRFLAERAGRAYAGRSIRLLISSNRCKEKKSAQVGPPQAVVKHSPSIPPPPPTLGVRALGRREGAEGVAPASTPRGSVKPGRTAR